MTIKVGDKVPSATLYEMGEGGPKAVSTDELFAGKTVAVFGVPGAFTPTCSAKHLPGYIEQSAALKAKGVDEIVCMSVNDAFVMGAWGKDQNAAGKVRMVADGSAELTKKMGIELDLAPRGLGMRSRRFSMVVKDGVVQKLNLEEGGAFEVSSAERMLEQI
ncbi:MAG: peroxiredoxin [Alphaproteobacteria bacterium]